MTVGGDIAHLPVRPPCPLIACPVLDTGVSLEFTLSEAEGNRAGVGMDSRSGSGMTEGNGSLPATLRPV